MTELSRRTFIGGALGAGGAALVAAPGCQSQRPATPDSESSAAFELEELTVRELQKGMEEGRYTSQSITQLYLSRIEALDRQGPALRTMIEVNPDALSTAESLDRERREKGPRSPLHGIPIVLKDNIDTADRMTTTAGSLALEGSIAPRDSEVAARLRAAGAVLLGKANMSEWANFRSERSSSGWSARGGQCRNPYILDRNPCGSSSGSGAAVAANLCAAAIGTETNGSIVCPANANGIVGVKPTVGLVSRSGIIPISQTQDTAGPMTRTVEDAAIVLAIIAGQDPADPATERAAPHLGKDYLTLMVAEAGLAGMRLGVARRYCGFHEKVDSLMEGGIKVLEELGAQIVDPLEMPRERGVGDASYQVMLYEFKAGLNAYFQALGGSRLVASLEELIAFNDRNAEREMPYFGQEIFIESQKKGALTDEEYQKALSECRRGAADVIDRLMVEHELDAIVAPTGGPAWVTDLVNGDHFLGGSSSPAAIAGYPNVTVPAGFVHGLPVGISFFGRAWSEETILRIAYAFEQATRMRKPPRFLPTLEA